MYKRNNARDARKASGWKSSGSNSNGRRGGGSGGRGRFTGDKIDINRFISKAVPQAPADAFKAEYTFAELPIDDNLKRAIARRGYSDPTPIQEKAIPAVLSGRDVIGLANTGTGKTAAFLIPMIHKILTNPEEKVLVVVPTRELAIQIEEEFFAFAQPLRLYAVVVVGGANIGRQITQLRRRHNMVIGTPGRLKDLVDRHVINLSQFSNVILDEADRMLDMGFINDVKWILSLVAIKRQIMLFSATFSNEIESLVKTFLVDPVKIAIATKETSKQIDQDIVRVAKGLDKTDVLHDLLNKAEFEKVLIFSRTKHGADRLSVSLCHRGFKAESIHGDKPHNKRQKALQMFKDNAVEILVATDVAARGLDIPNVSHVINFDIPATYADYIHRIGRTGRADKTGVALTFVEQG